MSKKKKVLSVKAGSKKPLKKTVKKGSKPLAKKTIKPASKPSKAKKVVKPAVKKAAKPSKPAKKPSAKKIVKPVKSKVAPKSKLSKAKVIKKVIVSKKPISSKTNVKAPAKSTPKKVEIKKPIAKVTPAPVLKVSVKEPKKAAVINPEKLKKAEEAINKKQLAEKKSQEVLAITNTIPVKSANEISASKIASISHSITNPVKKVASYSIKPEKEPAGKFEMEFVVHSSAEMLYEFLSSPSGLSEWFCDDLNIRNGIYTFIWEDQLQQARLLKTIELQLVRFQWVDKTDGSYFEFRIQRDDLTNDISLIITDFADSVSERESAKLLWHSQIEKLMHVIGSIF